MKERKQTRSHETTVELDADQAAVWKALTDPAQLVRWFPTIARATPGAGGNLHLAWDEDFVGDCPIRVWEPPHRLVIGWMEGGNHRPPGPLAVEFLLATRGAQTILRIVHSGFGTTDQWQDEYDGTSRGWMQESGSLALYLERHRQKDRTLAWARVPVTGSDEHLWPRLLGPDGFIVAPDPTSLHAGDPFAAVIGGKDRVSGTVDFSAPPRDFSGILDSHSGALFRLAIETAFGQKEAIIWFSMWGHGHERAREFVARWKRDLAARFR